MWNPTTPPGLWRYGPWERLGFVKHSLGDTLEASYCTNDLIAFGTIIIAKGFTATDPRSCHWHTILKLKFKPSSFKAKSETPLIASARGGMMHAHSSFIYHGHHSKKDIEGTTGCSSQHRVSASCQGALLRCERHLCDNGTMARLCVFEKRERPALYVVQESS